MALLEAQSLEQGRQWVGITGSPEPGTREAMVLFSSALPADTEILILFWKMHFIWEAHELYSEVVSMARSHRCVSHKKFLRARAGHSDSHL